MTKLTAESSIADIAARFNELNGTTTEVKTLAKRGKAKLLAQIEALEAKLPPASEPEPSGPIGSLAKQLLQHAERIGAQLEKELFASVPGGEAAVKQAAAVFNQVADEPTKAAIARLLDSGDKASMQYALQQITAIATQSGKLVVHNEPGFGQPAAEKGLTRDEYIAAINKHNLTDAEYQKLRAQRALGRQQGI